MNNYDNKILPTDTFNVPKIKINISKQFNEQNKRQN